jgi:hypothetical protein
MRWAELEDGATLIEVMVVVAIVCGGMLCLALLPGGGHAGTRTQTMMQVLGLFERAHNFAYANGATIQVAPAATGVGSDVSVYDAYSGGNVVTTTTTAELIGGFCVGGPGCGGGKVVKTFWIHVRRDGSFIDDVGGGDVGATTVTIGIDDGGQVVDAYTFDASELHAPVAPDS